MNVRMQPFDDVVDRRGEATGRRLNVSGPWRPLLRLLLAGCWALEAGCGDPALDGKWHEADESAMINGSPPLNPRDKAVGALIVVDQASGSVMPFCSGTLIAPRLILTAGHCLVPEFDLTNGMLFFGDILASPLDNYGQMIAVASMAHHPQYDSDAQVHDIAVVELAFAPTGIVPIQPVSSDNPLTDGDIGDSVRMGMINISVFR